MCARTGWPKNTQLFLLSTLFWIHTHSWVSMTHLLGLFTGRHVVSVSAPWAPCSTDPPGHLLPLARTVCTPACGHSLVCSRSSCEGFLAANCNSVRSKEERCERLLQLYGKSLKKRKKKITTVLFIVCRTNRLAEVLNLACLEWRCGDTHKGRVPRWMNSRGVGGRIFKKSRRERKMKTRPNIWRQWKMKLRNHDGKLTPSETCGGRASSMWRASPPPLACLSRPCLTVPASPRGAQASTPRCCTPTPPPSLHSPAPLSQSWRKGKDVRRNFPRVTLPSANFLRRSLARLPGQGGLSWRGFFRSRWAITVLVHSAGTVRRTEQKWNRSSRWQRFHILLLKLRHRKLNSSFQRESSRVHPRGFRSCVLLFWC